jgi:hypothetical protein
MLYYDSFSLRFLKKEDNKRLWSNFLKQAALDDAAAKEEEASLAADMRKGIARQATSLRLQLQSKLAGGSAQEAAGAAAEPVPSTSKLVVGPRANPVAGDEEDVFGRKLEA